MGVSVQPQFLASYLRCKISPVPIGGWVGLGADLDVLENGCLAPPRIHTPARPARILVAGMVRRVLRVPLYVFTQRSLEYLFRKTVFISQYLFPQLH